MSNVIWWFLYINFVGAVCTLLLVAPALWLNHREDDRRRWLKHKAQCEAMLPLEVS